MPRASDPRVVVRMSPEGYAAVKAAADQAGVSVGGLVRECAERFAAQVAAEARAGKIRLRRKSGMEGFPEQTRPPSTATGSRVAPSGVAPEPQLANAAVWALERQARLNKAKDGGR